MPNWDHLPNVVQIKRIIEDVKARPDKWVSTHIHHGTRWIEALNVATGKAYAGYRARDITRVRDISSALAGMVVSSDAPDALWITVHAATNASLLALVAWDSSADMLSLTPDALRTIIDTCDGDVKHHAVLLLPAVIALSTP